VSYSHIYFAADNLKVTERVAQFCQETGESLEISIIFPPVKSIPVLPVTAKAQ
jgi:hypothetical protein